MDLYSNNQTRERFFISKFYQDLPILLLTRALRSTHFYIKKLLICEILNRIADNNFELCPVSTALLIQNGTIEIICLKPFANAVLLAAVNFFGEATPI